MKHFRKMIEAIQKFDQAGANREKMDEFADFINGLKWPHADHHGWLRRKGQAGAGVLTGGVVLCTADK